MQKVKKAVVYVACFALGIGAGWGLAKLVKPKPSFTFGDGEGGMKLVGEDVKPDKDGVIRMEATDDMRKAAHDQMGKMVEEYFALPEKDRVAMLDKQIDQYEESQKMLKEMGVNVTPDGKVEQNKQGENSGPGEVRRVVITSKSGSGKDMMENVPAEIRAKLADYMKDLNKRRAERGLPPMQGPVMLNIRREVRTMG